MDGDPWDDNGLMHDGSKIINNQDFEEEGITAKDITPTSVEMCHNERANFCFPYFEVDVPAQAPETSVIPICVDQPLAEGGGFNLETGVLELQAQFDQLKEGVRELRDESNNQRKEKLVQKIFDKINLIENVVSQQSGLLRIFC